MNTSSMSKLLTGVVALLFTLVGWSAFAGSSLWNAAGLIPIAAATGTAVVPSAQPAAVAPAPPAAPPVDPNAYNASIRCDSLESQIQSSVRKVSPNVLRRSAICQGLDRSYGESRIDEDDEDFDEESENAGCSDSLNSTTCPEENAGLADTYRNEEKEARERKRDIENDLIDAEEDLNRMKQESEARLNDINDRVEDAGENFQKAGQNLLEELENKLGDQDDQLKQFMDAMQAQYNKWDENYVEMRDQFRAAEQAIAQANYSTEVQCRTEAQARLTETDKRIKERTDGLVGKKVNQSSSRVAGGKKRRFREYEKLRQSQYAEAYKMCLDGKSPAGAAVNASIKTAKDNFNRAKAKLADQTAVIENQRRQLLQRYAQLEQSIKGNKDKLTQQAQRRSEQQFQAYQKSMKRAEREYGTEQRNYQNSMNLYNRRQQMTYQQMSEVQSELYTAGARLSCARTNGGTMSESSGTRRLQQYDDAEAALITLQSSCRSGSWVYCPGRKPDDICSEYTSGGGSSTTRPTSRGAGGARGG